jgi:hypothetical protein
MAAIFMGRPSAFGPFALWGVLTVVFIRTLCLLWLHLLYDPV